MAVVEQLASAEADVIAIQETKLNGDLKKTNKVFDVLASHFPDYEIVHRISTPPARKGYSGTMFLYKKSLPEPIITMPEIGAPEPMDSEGRIITLEFPEFFITTVYTPNAGDGLNRLDLRGQWDDQYRAYLQMLDLQKPVLACGDFNAAYTEIDLANPKGNRNSAGFTDQEREKFGLLLAAGFTDSFRKIHGNVESYYAPDRSIYTWFAQRSRTAKINNSGWRIDYWLVSDRIAEQITRAEPLDSGARQDHVPIVLEINI